eukprot:10668600-Alexandrium_andersonii.AAC.1
MRSLPELASNTSCLTTLLSSIRFAKSTSPLNESDSRDPLDRDSSTIAPSPQKLPVRATSPLRSIVEAA